MHDHGVRLTMAGIDRLIETEAAAVQIGFAAVDETFLLDTGGVDNVHVGDARPELIADHNLVATRTEPTHQRLRHRQLARRHQHHSHALIHCQKLAKRVHSAAVLEIAHHGDSQPVHSLAARLHFLADGVEVKKRLARVFIAAITAIEDRYAAGTRELGDRSLLGMTHYDDVTKTREHARGIAQRLPFYQG